MERPPTQERQRPKASQDPLGGSFAESSCREGKPQRYLVGAHVYASIDPQSEADRKLHGFLHAMDGFPGYNVTVKERRPASPVKCTHEGCRKEIVACPHCNQQLRRTVERGIDTALLTDLIRSAFDNTFDQAILITEDSDFIPAVRFIQERWTKQIIHAFFRGKLDELRNACWKHIFFDDFMADLPPPPPTPTAPL